MRNYTTHAQEDGASPPVSMHLGFHIRPHCCLMERFWLPQENLPTQRSYTTRPPASGVLPAASAMLGVVTQRHCCPTERYWSLGVVLFSTPRSCTTRTRVRGAPQPALIRAAPGIRQRCSKTATWWSQGAGCNDGCPDSILSSAELYNSHPPAPVDFDGDGKSDIAVYRDGVLGYRVPIIGRRSDSRTDWGGLAQDKPVPADYDGDGKVDLAVYRDGTWFILRSSDGSGILSLAGVVCRRTYRYLQIMTATERQILAVYRDGMWFILRSSDGGQTSCGMGRSVSGYAGASRL